MTAVLPADPLVIWHDVECGGYAADLPLWRRLARAHGRGGILDLGAGTGRVALQLAAAGHAVTALDREPALLAALAERAAAAGLEIETVVADAAGFDLGAARFSLVLVPMQTIQLLPGAPARAALLTAVRRHLLPGGLLALALAEALEPFEGDPTLLPPPDVRLRDGWRFESQPVAVRELPGASRIERLRRAIAPDGGVTSEPDAIDLAALTVAQLEQEGRAAGLRPEPSLTIPATAEHVGSEVVLLRAAPESTDPGGVSPPDAFARVDRPRTR